MISLEGPDKARLFFLIIPDDCRHNKLKTFHRLNFVEYFSIVPDSAR